MKDTIIEVSGGLVQEIYHQPTKAKSGKFYVLDRDAQTESGFLIAEITPISLCGDAKKDFLNWKKK